MNSFIFRVALISTLFIALISLSNAYGTIFANSVVPVVKSTTSIPNVIGDKWTIANRANLGRIAGTNPTGFYINAASAPISISVAKNIDLGASKDLSIAGTSSTSLSSATSSSLTSSRTRINTGGLTTISSPGPISFSSTGRSFIQASNVTSISTGGLALTATSSDVNINGGSGFTFQTSSISIAATSTVDFTSSTATVALESSTTFSSVSNYIDFTASSGLVIAAGKNATVNAFAVVDAIGHLVNIVSTGDVSLASAQKDIRFDAATTITVASANDFSIGAGNRVSITTSSGSESDITLSAPGGSFDIFSTTSIGISSTDAATPITFNSDSPTVFTATTLNLNSVTQTINVVNLAVKTLGAVNLSGTPIGNVNAISGIQFVTEKFGNIAASSSNAISFNDYIFGVTSPAGLIQIAGTVKNTDYTSTSFQLTSGTTTSVTATNANYQAGTLSVSAPAQTFGSSNGLTINTPNGLPVTIQAGTVNVQPGVGSLAITGAQFKMSSSTIGITGTTFSSTTTSKSMTYSSQGTISFSGAVGTQQSFTANTGNILIDAASFQVNNNPTTLFSGNTIRISGVKTALTGFTTVGLNTNQLLFTVAGATSITATAETFGSNGPINIWTANSLAISAVTGNIGLTSTAAMTFTDSSLSTWSSGGVFSVSANFIAINSGNDLSYSITGPISIANSGGDINIDASQYLSASAPTVTWKSTSGSFSVSSGLDTTLNAGTTLDIAASAGAASWVSGSVFQSYSNGVATIKSTGSTVQATGSQLLLDGSTGVVLTSTSGKVSVTATGVDAQEVIRAGTTLTSTANSFQQFTSDRVQMQVYGGGLFSIDAVNQVQFSTGTNANAFLNQSSKTAQFTGKTVAFTGGKVLYTTKAATSVSSGNTQLVAAAGTISLVGANVAFNSGSGSGIYTAATTFNMQGNPIIWTSTTTSTLTSTANDVTFTSGGSTTFSAGKTGGTSSITSTNQDITFLAGRSLNVITTVSGASTPQISITATQGAVSITSGNGAVDLSAGGILSLAVTNTAAGLGTVSLVAPGSLIGVSGGAMSIFSQAQDSVDGTAIRLTTTDADGDIVLQSSLSSLSIIAQAGTFVTNSDDFIRIQGTGNVAVATATGTSAISNLGAFELQGIFGGFSLNSGSQATDTVTLTSTGASIYQAEDTITATAATALTVQSLLGAVRFGTANDKAISISSGSDASFLASNGVVSLLSDSTITSTAGATGNTVFDGATDIFVTTLGGPVNLVATDNTMGITGSTGNVTFSSGGDLNTVTNAGAISLVAGTVFTATSLTGNGAIAATTTTTLTSTASSLFITADGERTVPQDGLKMSTGAAVLITSTAATSSANFNAENLFAIGREQRSAITFNAAGTANQNGFTLNSFGNIDLTSGSTTQFNAATVLSVTGSKYLELSSDVSVSVTSVGTSPLHNVDVKANVGSVYVRGGAVSLQSANLLSASSTAHGINFALTSSTLTDTIKFLANNGQLEFNAKQLDLDTLSFTSNIGNLADWRGTTGIALTTTTGNGGKMKFISSGSLTASALGNIAIRTLLPNADISLTAATTTGIQVVASGSSGSPLVFAAGATASINSNAAINLSGVTGTFVEADDASGNDLLGDISLTTPLITVTAAKQGFIVGDGSVLLATQQVAGTADITLRATRDIRIESNDDSLFQAKDHVFSTTIGGVRIFTTQDTQGDVNFSADSKFTINANNREGLWETHNNFFGNILRSITFTSSGDRDSVGMLLSANGNNAEVVLRATRSSVTSNSNKNTNILSGVDPSGAISNVQFHSGVGGDVISGGAFLMHTTNNNGNIAIKADQAEVKYSFGDIAVSAGASMSFTANGDQSVFSQNSVYGIQASYTTSLTVQATNDTVNMHAGNVIQSTLSGALKFLATTTIGKSTGSNAGISFDSTGPSAQVNSVALNNAVYAAARDFTIDANSPTGGIVSLYSSGNAQFNAGLNMDFNNFGGVGNILVQTDPANGYSAEIIVNAPERFAVTSSLRTRVAAEDPSGANVRINSANSDVTIQQLGLSGNGLGVELRAQDGNIYVNAQSTGSVVFTAVQGVSARANNAVRMSTTGTSPSAISVKGGQWTVTSQRGTVTLDVKGSLSFSAGSNIQVETSGLVASDIFTTVNGATTITTTTGLATFGSNWGDARFETNSGAEIILQGVNIAVDPAGHFAIPFENREVPRTCNINGQLARFTVNGLIPSLLGLAPSRLIPNQPTNKGKLCVCFNGSWRCAQF